jgi:hypothetical protein
MMRARPRGSIVDVGLRIEVASKLDFLCCELLLFGLRLFACFVILPLLCAVSRYDAIAFWRTATMPVFVLKSPGLVAVIQRNVPLCTGPSVVSLAGPSVISGASPSVVSVASPFVVSVAGVGDSDWPWVGIGEFCILKTPIPEGSRNEEASR